MLRFFSVFEMAIGVAFLIPKMERLLNDMELEQGKYPDLINRLGFMFYLGPLKNTERKIAAEEINSFLNSSTV